MKKVIATANAPKAIGPYSQAIEAGNMLFISGHNMLFISGQIPVDPATGKVVEGGISAQTEQSLKNIKGILEEAGYTFDNIVKCTCFLSTMDDFAAMNEVYAKYFTANPPARAAFAVQKLPMGVLVEIEAIAVK